MYYNNTQTFGYDTEATRLTNAELREAFADGRSNVRNHTGSMGTIRLPNGDVALVGYGHAIYAENSDGHITVHEGWSDWAYNQNPQAEATPRHIRNLKPLADSMTSRTPSAASPPKEIREIGRLGMRRS